jgi:DNA processing protein
MTDPDELAAWLRLLETPSVGRASARKLLAAFGSPQAVLRASTAAKSQVIAPGAAQALAAEPSGFGLLLQATQEWLASSPPEAPRSVVTLGDPHYPPLLLEIADPPLLLYTQGQVEWLQASSVAMVGSRNPTPQGLENAQDFAQQLSRVGLTVVSGLALGIDGAAHTGALPHTGRTVAVVGTGLDRVYPSKHQDLARRIAALGLVVSEYPIGTGPLPHHFPQRNRIIAGLSQGLVVVQAALQSGSLISARLAMESGREVFAVPGSIHCAQSRGCHALIQQGAKLVECGQDILDELHWGIHTKQAKQTKPSTTATPQDRPTHPLLDALGFDPVSLDALQARTGWSIAALNTQLLALELQDQVARLPGQLFQRLVRA